MTQHLWTSKSEMYNVASDLRGCRTPWHQTWYHVIVSLSPWVLMNSRLRDHGQSSGHYHSSLSSFVCLFADVEERPRKSEETKPKGCLNEQIKRGELSVAGLSPSAPSQHPQSLEIMTQRRCAPGPSLMWPSGPCSVINLYESDQPRERRP